MAGVDQHGKPSFEVREVRHVSESRSFDDSDSRVGGFMLFLLGVAIGIWVLRLLKKDEGPAKVTSVFVNEDDMKAITRLQKAEAEIKAAKEVLVPTKPPEKPDWNIAITKK